MESRMRSLEANRGDVLSLSAVLSAFPSLSADHPHSRVSSKYTFVPTSSVLNALIVEGWQPRMVAEARVRDETREGFQRHMMRFSRPNGGTIGKLGDSYPEIVVVNSHDRSSGYQLYAGIFRMVCSNGMIVQDMDMGSMSVRHVGLSTDKIIEASYEVIKEFPQIESRITAMQSVKLLPNQRVEFATKALALRFPDGAPFKPDKLLSSWRSEDQGSSLWSTLNVVQENLMRGGQRTLTMNQETNRFRRGTVRAVKSIATDLKLNRGVWALADQYLKAA